jgi:hypothetical protein
MHGGTVITMGAGNTIRTAIQETERMTTGETAEISKIPSLTIGFLDSA